MCETRIPPSIVTGTAPMGTDTLMQKDLCSNGQLRPKGVNPGRPSGLFSLALRMNSSLYCSTPAKVGATRSAASFTPSFTTNSPALSCPSKSKSLPPLLLRKRNDGELELEERKDDGSCLAVCDGVARRNDGKISKKIKRVFICCRGDPAGFDRVIDS